MITEVRECVKAVQLQKLEAMVLSLFDPYTPLQPLVRAPLQTDSGIQGVYLLFNKQIYGEALLPHIYFFFRSRDNNELCS